MNLTTGILVIGSLYWDNSGRENWRKSRLKAGSEFPVAVPIRYGRKSSSRRDTYTMVFDPILTKLGHAKVIECINVVSSVSCLVCEAENLWGSERNCSPDGTVSKEWGCVALLSNPKGEIPKKLLDEWSRRVSQERDNYDLVSRADGSSVNGQGLLGISWPKMVDDGPLALDLLLATTNNASLEGDPPSYPTPQTIAQAWARARRKYPAERRDDYFWKNRQNGITTFQDTDIEAKLRQLGINAPQ